MRHIVGFMFALAAIATMSNARGNTIDYSTTINLNPADITAGFDDLPGDTYFQSVSGASPFNVQAGDTITGTITFANGELNLTGNVYDVQISFLGNAYTTDSSTIQLLGVSGSLQGSNPSSPLLVLGNGGLFSAYGVTAPTEEFSFTGFQYTINVSRVQAIGGTVETTTAFTPYAIEVAATGVSAVPEPASMLLILSGLGGLGIMSRKRKPN